MFLFFGNISATICKNLIFKFFHLVRKVFLICAKSDNSKGGIAVVENGKIKALLELPIAGLMSDEPLTTVNEKLENAKLSAYELGADKSIDPFMTLSFLSLPVIPSLRITTKGVFDAENWKML